MTSRLDAEWSAVREALRLAREWDIADAKGQVRVATRPDPMREIRALVSAASAAAEAER